MTAEIKTTEEIADDGRPYVAVAAWRPIAVELRSSPLLYLCPPLLGLGVWAAFEVLLDGVFYWPNAIMAVNVSGQLLGPIFAGLAAWLAGREHRRGLKVIRALSARPAWVFPTAELATVMIMALAVHLGILLIVGAYMLSNGAVGTVAGTMIISGALAAVFHPALGYLVGRLTPQWFIPPIVAVCAYLGAAILSSQSGRPWYLLNPVLNELVDPFGGPQPDLYARHAVWLVGLTLLLAAASLILADRSRLVVTVLVIGGMTSVVGGSLVSTLGGHYYLSAAPPFEYVCTTEGVTICMHPAFEAALPELHETLRPLAERLAESPAAITRLEQRPRGVGQVPSPGSQAIHLDWLSDGAAQASAAEYAEGLIDFESCFTAGRADGRLLTQEVVAWLLGAEALSGDEIADRPRAFLDGLAPAEASVWMGEHYREFVACQLTPEDFRG